MRLLLSAAAASGLCVVLLVAAACNPEAYNTKSGTNTATTTTTTTTTAPAAKPAAGALPTPDVPAEQPADGIRRITVAELRQALDEHRAVVVDVRNDVAYKSGHIQGAKLMPANEIEKYVNELPKDKLIVTYCS
jgi:Rhodanese-like domain